MIPRYTRAEMGRIWTSERRYRIWLDVELLACEAMVTLGEVPAGDHAALRRVFDGYQLTAADVARIEEIEKTVKHDVIAFLTWAEEKGGPPARHLHKGMTSSDVLDTTLAVQLAGGDRAPPRRRRQGDGGGEEAGAGAPAHADDGAQPRHPRRAHHLRPQAGRLVRRLGAAPGRPGGAPAGPWRSARSPARWAPSPTSIRGSRRFVMERLGLAGGEAAATQVVNRDRHAEYFAALALCGATLEQHATEVRHLQRTEVREAEEPFTAGQKGSSAMPHKRNPILSENLTGMARLLRGWALAALEDVALWHERDISHSSVERVIAPDATIALDFSLHRFAGMIENLRVYPARMQENLDQTGGLYEAQRVLLALVEKGVARQEGYVFVQRNAMKVWEEKVDFRTALKADAEVSRLLTAAEIDACFALEHHLKHVDTIFARVFGA